MKYQDPALRDMLAAEYVVGTLTGQARRRFEGLMGAHPALRKHVREWEERLNRLADSTPAVPPPEQAWRALQQRIFPEPPPHPWYQRMGFWRGLSLGSSVVAAALAVFLLVELPKEPPGYVVMINDTAERPVWMVSTAADMGRLYVKNLKAMDMPKDVQCLLWLKPEGSEKLYAIGVLPDKGDDAVIKVDQKMRSLFPGTLLVSVEHMSTPVPDKPESPLAYEGKWMPLTEI
jgi:anti-sigma-K factor RskA